jgi:hypothetical protein
LLEFGDYRLWNLELFKPLDVEQIGTPIVHTPDLALHLLHSFFDVLNCTVHTKGVCLAFWQAVKVFFQEVFTTNFAHLRTLCVLVDG